MRIILILFLFSLAIIIEVESQEPSETPPDVEVGEFSSSKFRSYEPIDNSVSNTTKTDTRTRSTIYQDQIRNRNSIENRSRDMLEMEQNVMREAQNSKPTDLFRYRVGLKNTGIKVVKLVIWDYQASYSDDFVDASHRMFRCSAKIKPNQSARFEGFSILPPIRVINAAETAKTFRERIMINRIEYDDGSSWQRPTWHEPDVVASEGGRGNCRLL